jgi:hypothetical protein
MVALLFFVTRLFKVSRDVGVTAAPVLFRAFATYQFIVGGVTVALALLLFVATRSRAIFAFAAFSLISLLLAIPIHSWTQSIGELYAAGQAQTEEFKAIHRMSSATYSSSALMLCAAGIALSALSSRRERFRTSQTTPLA